MEADKDRDGKISFEEFTKMVESTDVSMSMTLGEFALFFFSPHLPCDSQRSQTCRVFQKKKKPWQLITKLADQF